jgi:pimeloyl-ACP methyl ester carboxylesterase
MNECSSRRVAEHGIPLVEMVSLRCLLSLFAFLLLAVEAGAQSRSEIFEKTASLAAIFPADQVKALSDVLPADRQIRWKVFVPAGSSPSGVLVFVSPDASGQPQPGWTDILERQNLIWIAAEDFGNSEMTSRRVLAALMGATLAQQSYSPDPRRIHIAGMSGGGRIASTTITRFPQLFTGAMYIVGVDFWTPSEEPLLKSIAANRYVFLTGDGDFNQREVKHVYRKYRNAGVNQTLLMNLAGFKHQYPSARQLNAAIEFLDTGVPASP